MYEYDPTQEQEQIDVEFHVDAENNRFQLNFTGTLDSLPIFTTEVLSPTFSGYLLDKTLADQGLTRADLDNVEV